MESCRRSFIISLWLMSYILIHFHYVTGYEVCEVQPAKCENEAYSVYLPCYGSDSRCTYTKGFLPPNILPTVPQSMIYLFPAAAVNLTISRYLLSPSCKYPALNITWRPKIDASVYHLRGFYLHVFDGKRINISRSFNFSGILDVPHKVVFYYPCIVGNYDNGSEYTVRLYSLPTAPPGYSNVVEEVIYIPPLNRTPINENNTFFWTTILSASFINGSVTVNFQPAPPELKFTQYEVTLKYRSRPVSQDLVERRLVSQSDDMQNNIKVEFHTVMPGDYVILVAPYPNSACACRVGPNNDDCREHCMATSLRITVQVTPGPVWSTYPRPTEQPPVVISSLGTTGSPATQGTTVTGVTKEQIVGTVVGVAACFCVVIVIIIIIVKRPVTKTELKPPTVSLISCSDNEHHRDVVNKFAKLLEMSGNCNIVMAKTPQYSVYEWLLAKQETVSKIVLIHSIDDEIRTLRAMQFCTPEEYIPNADLFMAAIHLSLESRLIQSKLMHVYFPYTSSEYFSAARAGQTFHLMHEFGEFMLCIHGKRWKPEDLSSLTGSPEGKKLQAAIDDFPRKPEILFNLDKDDDYSSMDARSIISQLIDATDARSLSSQLIKATDPHYEDSGCELNYPSVPSST